MPSLHCARNLSLQKCGGMCGLSARAQALGQVAKAAKLGEAFRKYLVMKRPCSELRLSGYSAGLVALRQKYLQRLDRIEKIGHSIRVIASELPRPNLARNLRRTRI